VSDAASALTPFEVFLSLEQQSAVKHEWVAGELFVMAGGTSRHNRTAVRLAGMLDRAAEVCRVYVADMLVATTEVAYYPDVMVACGPLTNELYETAPCTIIEVSSPSSSVYDRREKRIAYQAMASLAHYVIVEPDQERVVHYRRSAQGPWEIQILGYDDRLTLTCPQITIDLSVLANL
jgi:Uma2 family endonuclease